MSKDHEEFSKSLYDLIINDYMQNNIFDTRLSEIFIEIIELMIRMIPDILKSSDYKFKIKYIKNSILSIPSSLQQVKLLSSLALRCAANNNNETTPEIAEQCLEILENCKEDIDTSTNIIISIAPLLYEYETNVFFEKIKTIESEELQDIALQNTMQFLVNGRPPGDPMDYKLSQKKVNYPTAVKICDLIEHLNIDSTIYMFIKVLVDSLVDPSSNNSLSSKIRERQLLDITAKLVKIINEKLPDKNNIKHDGYKIACFGALAKFRDVASFRTVQRWNELFPSREELKRSALLINNTADKIFVLAAIGKDASFNKHLVGGNFVDEANKCLANLNNPLDRAQKYELVAESYLEISNKKAARFLLEQAISIAEVCSDEQGRDDILGGLLELAHTIDPDLAQNLALSMDSKEELTNFNERLTTITLHADPKKIKDYNKSEINNILKDLFNKTIRTLCSGRGTIQHDEVIGEGLKYSTGQSFETICLGISWYIENIILRTKNNSESILGDLFNRVYGLLELIRNVEMSMYNNDNHNYGEFYKVLSETNLQTFSLNEQEEARTLIENWIANNLESHLKIYDPYFDESMLDLLKRIGTDARVSIYSSAKTADLERLPELYREHWRRICDNVPPETHFYIYATSSGSSPLHDRFILTDNNGLNLGTSLNGFGNKFSTIRFLEFEEKEKIERDIITPIVVMPPSRYKDEKLTMRVFSL